METLAYIHLALAYEAPAKAVTVPVFWQKRGTASIHLLSLSLPLAFLYVVSSASAVQINDSGSEVTALQNNLKAANYYDGPVTGYYGSLTQAAVKEFQAAKGLIADGIAGKETLAALQQDLDGTSTGSVVFSVAKRGLRLGDRGPEVKEIQERLQAAGFNPGSIDLKFGPQTEQAVRKFQATRGLFVDGMVGRETWFALRFLGSPIYPYLVIVSPGSAETLRNVLQYVPNAYLDQSGADPEIYAGAFPNQDSAKRQSAMLRSHGINARLVYIR